MKNIIFLLIIILSCASCTTKSSPYFDFLNGEWEIKTFYHGKSDLKLKDYFLLGFEKHNRFWILKRSLKNEFFSSDYEVFKQNDTIKIALKNCKDKRFDGVYDLYMDTIANTINQNILQITLDRENTYIKAIRARNKKE